MNAIIDYVGNYIMIGVLSVIRCVLTDFNKLVYFFNHEGIAEPEEDGEKSDLSINPDRDADSAGNFIVCL